MDAPTRDKPLLFLEDGPLMVERGYITIDKRHGKFDFISVHDGPWIRLCGPGDVEQIASVSFVPLIIEALQAAIIPPVAAPGTYDAEIRAVGHEPGPLPRT
jgi:hypothetical protein